MMPELVAGPFVFCLTITALAQIGTLSVPFWTSKFPSSTDPPLGDLPDVCYFSHRWPLEQVCRPCRPVASLGHGQGTVCLAHNVRVGNGGPTRREGQATYECCLYTNQTSGCGVSVFGAARAFYRPWEQFIPGRPFPHHACASKIVAP